MTRRLVLFLLFASFTLATGCVTVQPYQKGNLAKPKMQFDPDPQVALIEQHVFAYREGSVGGYGGGGGGCGCN